MGPSFELYPPIQLNTCDRHYKMAQYGMILHTVKQQLITNKTTKTHQILPSRPQVWIFYCENFEKKITIMKRDIIGLN